MKIEIYRQGIYIFQTQNNNSIYCGFVDSAAVVSKPLLK